MAAAGWFVPKNAGSGDWYGVGRRGRNKDGHALDTGFGFPIIRRLVTVSNYLHTGHAEIYLCSLARFSQLMGRQKGNQSTALICRAHMHGHRNTDAHTHTHTLTQKHTYTVHTRANTPGGGGNNRWWVISVARPARLRPTPAIDSKELFCCLSHCFTDARWVRVILETGRLQGWTDCITIHRSFS